MLAVLDMLDREKKEREIRLKEAIQEKSIEIAKKLLKENMSIEKIAEITGLTKKNIKTL